MLLDVDELVVGEADVVGRCQVGAVKVKHSEARPNATVHVDGLGRGSHGEHTLYAVESVDGLQLDALLVVDVLVELVVVGEGANLVAVALVERGEEVEPIIEARAVGALDDDARELVGRSHKLALESLELGDPRELSRVLARENDHASMSILLVNSRKTLDELLVGEQGVHGVDDVDTPLLDLILCNASVDGADTGESLALLASLDAQGELRETRNLGVGLGHLGLKVGTYTIFRYKIWGSLHSFGVNGSVFRILAHSKIEPNCCFK